MSGNSETLNGSRGKSAPSRFDGWSLDDRDPQVIEFLLPLWEWFYRHYFQAKVDGWEHIPAQGKLLAIGSHNGGLAAPDMFMLMSAWFQRFGTERLAYGLMHPKVWEVAPVVAKAAVQCGAIIARPKTAIAALKRDAAVIVYPGGAEDVFRPYHLRHQVYFAGRKGFIKLALQMEIPLIPVVSVGAHDTLIVLGDFYNQLRQLNRRGMPWLFNIDPVVFPVYLGLPWGLGIGPLPNLPLPVPIHIRICRPIVFDRYGRAAASDRAYVDYCYQQTLAQMQMELDGLIASVNSPENKYSRF